MSSRLRTTITSWQPTVQGLPQAPVSIWLLLVGRRACGAGLAGAGNARDFLVVVPEGNPVLPLLGERLFAFMKFIMCLLVPEVKAVSCAQVMHMQVLESNGKNAV